MTDKILELIEDIFAEIPFSKESEDAKKKIQAAFISEYEKLLADENSPTQALGMLMYTYGTFDNAVKLIGLSDEEMKQIKSNTESTSQKEIQSSFKKIKRFALIGAIGIYCCINYALNGLLYKDPLSLILIAIALLIIGFCFLRFNKIAKKLNYTTVTLSKDTLEFLMLQKDRYRKRFLNNLILGFVLICVSTYSAFLILSSGMDIMQFLVVTVMNSIWVTAVIILFINNALRLKWIENFFANKETIPYKKYVQKLCILSFIFMIVTFIVMLCTHKYIYYFGNFFFALLVIYLIGIALYNFKARKHLVRTNLVINKKRIIALSTAIILFVTANIMRMDSWLTQPYISTISSIDYDESDIQYDEETGVYTIVTDKKDFKILQLTDVHLGGSALSSSKDLKALEAVYALIEYTSPDFIVVTGDIVFPLGVMSFSFNNYTPAMQFVSFMRNIGIPWAFTFGNHDTEVIANNTTEDITTLFESLSYDNTQSLLYPDVQPDITGRSNQVIKIENTNGNLIQAIILLDSNDYTGEGINDYDYIHDDQVEWYEEQIKKLSAEEGKTISSLLFYHIPVEEYKTAYDLYKQGSDEVKYFYGVVGEKNEAICCSNYPSKLFEKAVELGSTKAMFVGHDHYNNISLEYKGIRLTYGMSIDYLAMPGIAKKTQQRGATLITLHSDSSFDLEPVRLIDIKH